MARQPLTTTPQQPTTLARKGHHPMVWVTRYGWQCDCGKTSVITVPDIDDARAGLRHHLKDSRSHHAELVEVHDEESDDDYEDDEY
ncbi:hypothetical protein [Actinosynnema sp. NPDC023587]|uniref:hypothetical protein n=1 Tax=Actinosynnema sp. NPDC023587 TaxID=3154695 RepID=UPI0033EF427C